MGFEEITVIYLDHFLNELAATTNLIEEVFGKDIGIKVKYAGDYFSVEIQWPGDPGRGVELFKEFKKECEGDDWIPTSIHYTYEGIRDNARINTG